MATQAKTIKFTAGRDSRDGDGVRYGINGRIFNYRVGQTVQAEPEEIEHLRDNGISFEEVSGRAGSKEGSADPAPENTKPHMLPRSVEDRGDGGNSGDVTAGGGSGGGSEENKRSVAEDAAISDIRVAAERRTPNDAPVAELAGEGEQGTPKAQPAESKPAKAKK